MFNYFTETTNRVVYQMFKWIAKNCLDGMWIPFVLTLKDLWFYCVKSIFCSLVFYSYYLFNSKRYYGSGFVTLLMQGEGNLLPNFWYTRFQCIEEDFAWYVLLCIKTSFQSFPVLITCNCLTLTGILAKRLLRYPYVAKGKTTNINIPDSYDKNVHMDTN